MTRSVAPYDGSEAAPALADLVKQVTSDAQRLVRAEIALARAEMTVKAKAGATGAGLFGVAAVLGWFAIGVFITAAVLGLAIVWPAWLAALVVGGALVLVAAVLALAGRLSLRGMQPIAPARTMDSVRADLAAVREAAHR